MSSFQFRDTAFTYSDYDRGPAIIFLHGHLENRGMWKKVIASLPKSYRKLSLDLPGHGGSGNLGYVHSMEEMAELVKAFADHKRLRRFILCGHSMGGYVALAFADLYPKYLKGVILMNSNAKADNPLKQKSRDQAIAVAKRNHQAFIRRTIPMLFRPKHRRGMHEEVRKVKQEALKTSKQGTIAAIEGMKIRKNREALLNQASFSFLFIAAENDPVIPFEILRPQISAARVQGVIAQNGHMSHLEDFDLILPPVKKFLRENI